ncbi:MAG: type II toxin-antitoxin system PemK/MazF family toxin [Clostridiales bacterium]|nr:type II toxin-antitoxin system PemK/MazF family toxin [Clostridiales bacterium]
MTNEEKTLLGKAQRINIWNSKKLYYCVGKKYQRSWIVKRGEVFFADLGENIGSEENKIRPVVVLQSNSYNISSPVFTCAIISTSPQTIPDIQIPITEKYFYTDSNGKPAILSGTIDLGQIKTIGKERIISSKICKLSAELPEIDIKLLNILGLSYIVKKKDNIINSLNGKINYLKEQAKTSHKNS